MPKRKGRRRLLTDAQCAEAAALIRSGYKYVLVAERFGVSIDALVSAVRAQGVPPREKQLEEGADCSRPPPPPPGFDERDLRAGRPFGSVHAKESDWQDGAKPAAFEARASGLVGWY